MKGYFKYLATEAMIEKIVVLKMTKGCIAMQ
jgi:hypothetical protein